MKEGLFSKADQSQESIVSWRSHAA